MVRKQGYSCNKPWRPKGLWDVEAPTFSRQSAHRWLWGCQLNAPAGRPLPPEYSWFSFLLEAESTQGHSATGRIRPIEKYDDLIGNRTRDLPACSIVFNQLHYRVLYLCVIYSLVEQLQLTGFVRSFTALSVSGICSVESWDAGWMWSWPNVGTILFIIRSCIHWINLYNFYFTTCFDHLYPSSGKSFYSDTLYTWTSNGNWSYKVLKTYDLPPKM
jgi:hypothetical protein